MTGDDDPQRVNPGFVVGQIARALAASASHQDPAQREQARQRADRWSRVFQGIVSGTLAVGSRTPVLGTPAWATLRVMTGGFVTGDLLAGGALQPDEQELSARLGLATTEPNRAALNSYYLGDAGLAELRELLRTGCYRIRVPEEGALLVVAWLLDRGHPDEARGVLDQIGPWLGRLRFYPARHQHALAATSAVHVQPIGQTLRDLAGIGQSAAVVAERESLLIWLPLYDRLVALFLETVEGALPSIEGAGNRRLEPRGRRSSISGGWPCQRYPEGWHQRAGDWLVEYSRQRTQHSRCRRPDLPRANFAVLRTLLGRCLRDSGSLSGREVGRVRMVLAQVLAKRGLPQSPSCRALREAQTRQARRPTVHELARVVAGRLQGLSVDAPLAALEPVLAPVAPAEAKQLGVPSGESIPGRLRRVLARCLAAPPWVLVQEGAIPSGEVLARVVPQLTARVGAAAFSDPELARLYAALYEAFRKRRSLLLLNLESQVHLDEIPWLAVIASLRTDRPDLRAVARTALEDVVSLALTAFPQAILPNKLLQEVRALAHNAGLDLPIVDEVAADIFAGEFTEKFLRAAQLAGSLLAGSLYERYYGIPYDAVGRIRAAPAGRGKARTSRAFLELCSTRACEAGANKRGSVAYNGAVIEQEQILNTHNLAVLVDGLALEPALRPQLPELSKRCFDWICWRQQREHADWRARLHMRKNTAYAWRQMVFFLALQTAAAQAEFLGWAAGRLAAQRPSFRERFSPIVDGLRLAAASGAVDSPAGARVKPFLGWIEADV